MPADPATAAEPSEPSRSRRQPPQTLRTWWAGAIAALAAAAVPSQGLAQQAQDLPRDTDARLRGYFGQNVLLDESSTALTYMLLIFLAVVAAGVMFKSGRRTHLD